jgi:hypothetical protein
VPVLSKTMVATREACCIHKAKRGGGGGVSSAKPVGPVDGKAVRKTPSKEWGEVKCADLRRRRLSSRGRRSEKQGKVERFGEASGRVGEAWCAGRVFIIYWLTSPTSPPLGASAQGYCWKWGKGHGHKQTLASACASHL